MAQIDGGGIHFKSELDNEAIKRAVDETMTKIEGLSSSMVEAGKEIEKVFDSAAKDAKEQGLNIVEVFDHMKQQIDASFNTIDAIYEAHKLSLNELLAEQEKVSQAMGKAFTAGRDDEYRSLRDKLQAIEGEIETRKKLMRELEKQADELLQVEGALDKYITKTKESGHKTTTFESQIRRVRSEMQLLLRQGVSPLDEGYQKLQNELSEMMNIQRSVQAQGKALSHNQAGLQGIISGVSGLSGAMSSATGIISLFAGRNEDLSKVMTRLQAVMATTIGLQQVSAVLHKDSAFQLKVVAGAKNLLATAANRLAAAFNISDIAAKRLLATLSLGLSVALTAVITLVTKYINKINEAKKEQEQFYRTIADNVYKPIGSLKMLEAQYNRLGSAIKEKEQFIRDNKKEFEALGITVNSVADAERLLTDPANVQKFVQAQVIKAKAVAQLEDIMDKQQELMQKQLEYDRMPDTTSYFVQTDSFGGGQWVTGENEKKKQLKKEIDGLNADLQFGYKLIAQTEQEAADQLKEINKEAEDALKGSISYYRNLIKEKTEVMETLNDPAQVKKARDEIKRLQDILNDLEGRKSESTEKKDPFEESLKTAKAEYEKYFQFTTSTDEKIRNSAESTFSEQLKQGATYLEFLERKRDDLLKSDPSIEVSRKLKLVNEQIAQETQAHLSNDNKMYNDHFQQLVEEYYLYFDTRKKIQEDFDRDMAILNEQSMQAESEAQKKFIQTMIDNRRREYQRAMRDAGTGDPEYDKLLQEYESYEGKRNRIAEEYAQKRALAMQKGDAGLINQLNKAEEKEIQQVNFDQIMGSDTYVQLFSNLDRLTVEKMIELRNKIESEWEKLNLSPEQLEALRSRIDEITNTINKKNPFAALADSIKRYKSGEKGVDFKDIAKSAAGTIELVKGSLDAVMGGLTDMGLTGDEITQQLISDIADMAASAGELAMGIATGNPLQIIQGSIGMITSAFKVFNTHDRQADRQIAKHAENLRKLEESYNDLEKAIDKALGSGRYTTTQNAIRNLEKQQKEIAKQAQLERDKKKSDPEKVKEYEQALKEAKEQQKELVEQLREDILGLDAKSAAEQLGQAFVDAFREGEDAIEAFGKKADDIVANIMQKMLVQKLLEQPLGNLLDRYTKKWYDDRGNFIGFDTVIRDADSMGKEIKGLGEGFAKAMESLPDDIRKYFTGDTAPGESDSLSGAIKGVSEETASKLGGQINAIRMNQAEANDLLRQQLMHLSVIARNSDYNKHLKSIDDKLGRMETSGSLRSQGLM